MKEENILKLYKKKSLKEINSLCTDLKHIYWEKYHSMYKEIHLYPGSNMTKEISDATGFECIHRPCEGYSAGRGTHVVIVPTDKYTEELRKSIVDKYDRL